MGSRVSIPIARATDVEEMVGRWDFSAHDYSDEELVHCAQTMFQHAFTMPEVSEFVIPPGKHVFARRIVHLFEHSLI